MSHSRIMFAGTNSGCGKTTVTCAVMKALANQGDAVIGFKCGPDYIDPMFHTHITGYKSTNLDAFFMNGNDLNWLMDKHLSKGTIGIAEGVMGLFDGIGLCAQASSFDVAMLTHTPIILVVNAKGMALSIVALLKGFIDYAAKLCNEPLIQGCILNHVGKGMYTYLKDTIEKETGLKVVGYFDRQTGASLESRHLGLITAAEISDLDERMNILAQAAMSSIDLNLIKSIANKAEPLTYETPRFCVNDRNLNAVSDNGHKPLRLGVAMDKAFCFYYKENLDYLESFGIQLHPFSPMHDDGLPKDIHGLYIGGGYPELFMEELSDNTAMLNAVKDAVEGGLPTIAECGGFMYLHEFMEGHAMCGVISGSCRMTNKLGPFGYVHLTSGKDDVFGKAGSVFCGHEFHYSESDNVGEDYQISKLNKKSWQEVHSNPNMYAGYPHLYFYSNPEAIQNFVKAMEDYK